MKLFKAIFGSDIFKLCASLFVIAALVALMLAGVNMLTASRIAARANEAELFTIRQYYSYDAAFTAAETAAGAPYFIAASPDGTVLGYSATVTVKGYGGDMQIMVCFDTAGAVTGIGVISMSETQGVGTRITGEGFFAQFSGRNAPFKLVKTTPSAKNHIVAITGASVSSEAAVRAVNDASTLLADCFTEE